MEVLVPVEENKIKKFVIWLAGVLVAVFLATIIEKIFGFSSHAGDALSVSLAFMWGFYFGGKYLKNHD
jgi:hypothetical protein